MGGPGETASGGERGPGTAGPRAPAVRWDSRSCRGVAQVARLSCFVTEVPPGLLGVDVAGGSWR